MNLLVSAAAAVLLSACSSSVERFSQNPSDADPVYTASVPPDEDKAIPADEDTGPAVAKVDEDEVMAKPLSKARIKQKSRSQDYADNGGYAQPDYGRKRGYAEESAEAAVVKAPRRKKIAPPVETAELDQPMVEPAAADETPVTSKKSGGVRVEEGMTLYSIARANGMPVAKVAAANGIDAPYSVAVGQVIKIPGVAKPKVPQVALKMRAPAEESEPVEEAVAEVNDNPEAKPIKIKKPLAKTAGLHSVKSGETLFSLGRKYGVHPYAIASANGLEKDTALAVGQQVKIPAGGKPAALAEAVEDASEDEAPRVRKAKAKIAEKLPEASEEPADSEAVTEEEAPAPKKVKKVKQVAEAADEDEAPAPKKVKKAKQVAEATDEEEAPAPKKVKKEKQVAEATDEESSAAPQSTQPGFRWPVKGKVISGYGPKSNGLRNEGINLAVPEGTSVRAAESGVVAYAGNELKGYGNLVLVRHEGGWVTAYAHAKELFVKRGDTVKRGDVIAKAGQTGSVTSPQLHFEIRKGATAMDPMRFLNSATAAN